MIKRLLALDGVLAVCRFMDDGTLAEAYGPMDHAQMLRLAGLAHDYRRMLQGHTDQLSMFSGRRGWTPARAVMLRGDRLSVCGVANIVCLVDNRDTTFNDLLLEMHEVAHW